MRREWKRVMCVVAMVVLAAIAMGAAAPNPAEAKIKLTLKNSSYETVYVAINYLVPNGKWITRGWWTVEPGDSLDPEISTNNSHIYFYAEGSSGGKWTGEGDSEAIERWIVDEKFDWYDDQSGTPSGKNPKQVLFFHREIKGNSYTQNFTD